MIVAALLAPVGPALALGVSHFATEVTKRPQHWLALAIGTSVGAAVVWAAMATPLVAIAMCLGGGR